VGRKHRAGNAAIEGLCGGGEAVSERRQRRNGALG
jgi:hypothetical protein